MAVNPVLIIQASLQLLPITIEVIKKIEAAIPGQGQGEQKLVAAREILSGIYLTSGGLVEVFETAWPALQKIIGAVVGLFNRTGAFKTAKG